MIMMKDQSKTKQVLIQELSLLRQKIAELEQSESERKGVEEALREKSHLNQTILDAFPCVALLLRPQTRDIIASNTAAVKVGAIPGTHCFSTWGQRQDPCPWCLAPALWATGEAQHLEVEALGIFWDAYWIPVAEDLYMHFAIDITRRKKAEEALRAVNAYNRSLIEASIDPLVTISLDGKITDVNTATERVTGYTRDVLIGTDFSSYFSDPEAARVGYRRVFTEGHVRDYPLEIRHCDGHVTPVFYNATLYHNEKGEVSGIFAAARDITERKRAKEQLHASLREKDILLREIHHRVKNNMQVISSLLDIQARASGKLQLIEMLHESQRRIQAMALVHEKLYASQDFSRIDMAGYVDTLSQELFQSYKVNPWKIEMIVQTDGVYLDINKGISCGLILNELISNALKHAFPGDRQGELQIIIGVTENTEIEIVVRDNGVGLPDDVDIHQPRTVGLYLVNGLVKNQLDGQIEVRRDNGTEFRMTFPL
jgi:PAS domain S-box-containing protein